MLKKILLILYTLTLILFVTPPLAHAQNWGGCVENEGGAQVASLACLPIVFSNIVTAALEFVGAVAVILLVYAGIRFVTSGGDPKQTQAARQIITYALIGLVLVLCSFAIIFFVGYLTGATCIEKLSFTSCS